MGTKTHLYASVTKQYSTSQRAVMNWGWESYRRSGDARLNGTSRPFDLRRSIDRSRRSIA